MKKSNLIRWSFPMIISGLALISIFGVHDLKIKLAIIVLQLVLLYKQVKYDTK